MKRMTLLLAFGASLLPAIAGVRVVGNGGDKVGLDFVQTAERAIDTLERLSPEQLPRGLDLPRLRRALDEVEVWSEDTVHQIQADGREVERDAVNLPDRSPPAIIVSRARWMRQDWSEEERMTLALHEYLGVLRVEVNRYDLSRKVTELLTYDPTAPVLLYEERLGEGKSGLSRETAFKICGQHKELYRKQYFLVYCTFRERSWQEIRYDIYEQIGYEFLGYDSASGSNSSSSSGSVTGYYVDTRTRGRGRNQRGRSYGEGYSEDYSNSESSSWSTSTPVIREVRTPVSLPRSVDYAVYGIEVWAVGELSRTPWRTVRSSLNFADGQFSFRYDSEFAAKTSCFELLFDAAMEFETRWTYHNARCTTPKLPDGNFAYEIRSQNPFLPLIP